MPLNVWLIEFTALLTFSRPPVATSRSLLFPSPLGSLNAGITSTLLRMALRTWV